MKSVDKGKARVALVGLGHAGLKIHLPALAVLPGVQIVAVCDPDAARREQAKLRWKVPAVYDHPSEMLEKIRPDITVVASPPQTHYEICRLGLDHSSHIFCEKPFVLELDKADRLIALAAGKGRLLAVNHQYYRMPIFEEVSRQLQSGKTGQLYHVELWQHMFLLPEHESGWKRDLAPRRVLMEFGGHAIELICRFFDSLPDAVTARAAELGRDAPSDGCVALRMDFPAGRFANIVLNRMSYAPVKYMEMRLDCEKAALRVSYGGKAHFSIGWNSLRKRPHLDWSLTRGGEVRFELPGGRLKKLATQSGRAVHEATRAHFTGFLQAIEGGTKPEVSGRHAREVLRIVLAAYESLENGGRLVALR